MEIRKIFVVGSGLMGSGIAQTAIQAGYEVILNDQSKAALERGQAGISKRLERLVEKGRMTAEEKEAWHGRLTTSVSVHVASNVDMVIEAIYENLEAKQSIFQQLDKICDSRHHLRLQHLLHLHDQPSRRHQPSGEGGGYALLLPRCL